MPTRVLVVDDSGFFRRRVSEMLNADPMLEVVGTAENGEQAILQASKLRPDVITMDIEMPVMDGIAAVRRIMAVQPTPILMFSSLTTEGAQATLAALEAGALDFLPKRFEDISRDRDEAKHLLCQRVRALGQARGRAWAPRSAPLPANAAKAVPHAPVVRGQRIKLVAIGTSTGGPVALQQVLSKLPADFAAPLLLVQHMPATFTPAFAQRLDQLCAISVRQAKDGDELRAGVALLAPGGQQMVLEARGGHPVVRIKEAESGQTYRPSVDLTFSSIAQIYPGDTLAIVLTGMGADGREGCRLLKQGGSEIWAQDQQSSVVYGMPAAVVEAGLVARVLGLNEIGPSLAQRV